MTYLVGDLPHVRAQLGLDEEPARHSSAPSDVAAAPAAPFDVSTLPAVRAQLERDAAAAQEVSPAFARAPTAAGPQQTGARPIAITRTTR